MALGGCKAPILVPSIPQGSAEGAALNGNPCLSEPWPFFHPHTQQAALLQWGQALLSHFSSSAKALQEFLVLCPSPLNRLFPLLLCPILWGQGQLCPCAFSGSSVCTRGCAA